MNSSLYECTVMHHRLSPVKNRFVYRVFMFFLDVDELETLHGSLRLFGYNRPNIFSFRDTDHVQFGKTTVKENIAEYLRRNGISLDGGKVYLLTNVRTFGHVFNPVSFYFCFDAAGRPLCAVPEVGNTFGELKPYMVGPEDRTEEGFRKRVEKFFYVSPFIDHDVSFDFNLRVPDDVLRIAIDDYQHEKKIFLSAVTGVKKPLTDGRLLWYTLRFPFITLQVVGLIHWQAFKLWLHKLPYRKKSEQPELQKEAMVWNK